MTHEGIVELTQGALWLVMVLGGPVMGVALVVGVVISTVQAATQINEMTLTFIPKILAVGGVLWVMSGWLLDHWLSFTYELWANLGNGGMP